MVSIPDGFIYFGQHINPGLYNGFFLFQSLMGSSTSANAKSHAPTWRKSLFQSLMGSSTSANRRASQYQARYLGFNP